MKNKIGRPRLLDESPKDVLVGARIGKEEERQIEREAQAAGQTKSEWVRQRLLGRLAQVSRADLRTLWSPAKILLLDGQEISTGLIKLRTPPSRGVFVPDRQPCPPLDIPPGTKLVAEIEKHRFDLTDWEYCGATVEFGDVNACLGPHYHFSCPLQ
jgi:hypothetical protein